MSQHLKMAKMVLGQNVEFQTGPSYKIIHPKYRYLKNTTVS